MPVRFLPRLAPALLAVLLAAGAQAQTPGAALDATAIDAEAAFDEARTLHDGGFYASAERALARFLDRFPRDPRAPEALYLRADAALATDDAAGAAALFQRFEREYPTHPLATEARLALGRYYYARGDDAAAEDALTAALARPGTPESSAEAAYLLGLVHRRQGRPEAAAAAFERAAEGQTATAPLALYAVGTLRVERSEWGQAADAFGRLQARYGGGAMDRQAGLAYAEALVRDGRLAAGADEAERRIPTLDGDNADRAALLAGESHLRLNDPASAAAVLATVSPDGPYARRAALARGRAEVALGDLPTAVDLFRIARAGASDRREDDAVAHEASYYEGVTLKALGQVGAAETRLAATVERRPRGAYAEAALLELGVLRYERRQYAEAARALQALLDQSPRGPYAGEAARMLGEAYAASGDAARARQAFQLAESLGTATAGTRAEIAFQDAYALFRDGRYGEATAQLLSVAEADPDGPRAGEALFWAGESAFQNREYARAESILTRFLDRHRDHGRADAARYVLAWTHFRRRDWEAAALGFERFLSAYSQSSELVPYYADALLRLGDAYTTLGRYREARQVYARVAQATPDRQGGDYALYQTAQAFGREGQPDDALLTYDRLLRDYPESGLFAQALLAQGALRSGRGEDSLAVAAYQRVLVERAASPAAPAALLGIADVRINQRRFPEAEREYRRVLERYPASPLTADAFGGLADALDAQGRSAELDRVFAEVDAALSGTEARSRLRYARAQVALAAGQDSVAVVYLEEALSGPPPADVEENALFSLAGAYVSTGQPLDAARALRRLLSRFPDSALGAEAQLRLAEALYQAGDLEGARGAAARLPVDWPGDAVRAADALVLEARALTDLGRPAESDDRLRTILRRYPDSPAADAVRADRPDLVPPPGTDVGNRP